MNRHHTEGAASSLPRVLLVGPRMKPPFYGGVEKGVDMLLRSPLAQQTEMHLFNNYRHPRASRPILARIYNLQLMVRALWKELKERPVDLVHVKTSIGNNFHQNALYALTARRMGLPVILQIHSGRFESFYRQSHPLVRAWVRYTLSSADRVAVLSSFWVDRIAALAPDARPTIVPNGLDEMEAASLAEEGGRRSEQVLFIGTGQADTTQEKGLDDLLAVMPGLLSKYPKTRWVLAGLPDPESTRRQLLSSIASGCQHVADQVQFMGVAGGEAKLTLLRESSILAFPSYFENMPNLLLEAMAAGMGVVASRVGAVPEMLGQGAGGILIQARNREELQLGLQTLLSAPARVRELGERNRRTVVEKYTMNVVQEKLRELYQDVTGWPGSGRTIGEGDQRVENDLTPGFSSTRVRGKAV